MPYIIAALERAVDHGDRPIAPPPEPLTVEVTLNGRDSEDVRALAEEDYRTPAQQVGWIVSQWLKPRRLCAHGFKPQTCPMCVPYPKGTLTTAQPTIQIASAAPAAPPAEAPAGLMPLYHVGDGSAGSGCGKVGLLVARRLTGTVQPGDVFHCGKPGGAPCHHEAAEGAVFLGGPLTCCQCGGAMSPASWSYGDDDRPERPTTSRATMARMETPQQ